MLIVQQVFARICAILTSEEPDRGDVPGWVMVTVMSAILVVAIIAVFEPQIKDVLKASLDSVSGSK
jgi:hypothetical protein